MVLIIGVPEYCEAPEKTALSETLKSFGPAFCSVVIEAQSSDCRMPVVVWVVVKIMVPFWVP